MAAIEFTYETLYNESYAKYGDRLSVCAFIKSAVERGGYYDGCETITSVELQVFDKDGKEITKELESVCKQEVKLIEMEAESMWNNKTREGF